MVLRQSGWEPRTGNGERRTAGRMLVLRSWEAVEKTSLAPPSQRGAPGT